MIRKRGRLSTAERTEMLNLHRRGMPPEQIAEQVGRSFKLLHSIFPRSEMPQHSREEPSGDIDSIERRYADTLLIEQERTASELGFSGWKAYFRDLESRLNERTILLHHYPYGHGDSQFPLKPLSSLLESVYFNENMPHPLEDTHFRFLARLTQVYWDNPYYRRSDETAEIVSLRGATIAWKLSSGNAVGLTNNHYDMGIYVGIDKGDITVQEGRVCHPLSDYILVVEKELPYHGLTINFVRVLPSSVDGRPLPQKVIVEYSVLPEH